VLFQFGQAVLQLRASLSAWCSARRSTRISFWLSWSSTSWAWVVPGRLPGAVKAGGVVQLVDQLLQRDSGSLDQRLHGVDRLQRGVDVDRVVDLEHGFADVVAAAGGAADHLLVEDARCGRGA
jgi:hypothetical protein